MLRLKGTVAIVTGSSSGIGKALALRFGPLMLSLSVLSSGCGLMMIGPPAEKIDVESGTNEQKNLEAIRAMQAESRACPTDGVVGQRCAER